jgi:hypothetical protein
MPLGGLPDSGFLLSIIRARDVWTRTESLCVDRDSGLCDHAQRG